MENSKMFCPCTARAMNSPTSVARPGWKKKGLKKSYFELKTFCTLARLACQGMRADRILASPHCQDRSQRRRWRRLLNGDFAEAPMTTRLSFAPAAGHNFDARRPKTGHPGRHDPTCR